VAEVLGRGDPVGRTNETWTFPPVARSLLHHCQLPGYFFRIVPSTVSLPSFFVQKNQS
jgi:hypothetical protein